MSSKISKNQIITNRIERFSNFEALRIVCMLFIVAGHLIMWHDFHSETIDRVISCGIRPFFMVAVNCFVLISGWFGIKYSFKKILTLNNTLTFWVFVLGALAIWGGLHEIFLRKDILMVVPLITKKYWFITIYVALCLLAPYLNILVDAISRKEFKRLLITCICLFVILPSVGALFNFESVTADSGYGIVNFMLLYLLGRYMRLHRKPQKSEWLYLGMYLASMTACGLFQIVYSRLLGFEFTTFISYDTFFVFVGAVALFCAFSRMTFSNKWINTLATACFAVYIIHIHPWIGGWAFEDLLGMKDISDGWFMIYLFVVPCITYLGCFLLEQIRIYLAKRMFNNKY